MTSSSDWLNELGVEATAAIQADAGREMIEAGQRALVEQQKAVTRQHHVDRLNGFHVVPRQLVILAEHLGESAGSIHRSVTQLRETKILGSELGLLGRRANSPEEFNRAVEELLSTMSALGESITKAAEEVRMTAGHYVRQDDDFYRGFEKLDPAGSVPKMER